jgi:hypothetical protein
MQLIGDSHAGTPRQLHPRAKMHLLSDFDCAVSITLVELANTKLYENSFSDAGGQTDRHGEMKCIFAT